MPGPARHRRWVLWMLDYGQYMGQRAGFAAEKKLISIWRGERDYCTLLYDCNFGEYGVDDWVCITAVHSLIGIYPGGA